MGRQSRRRAGSSRTKLWAFALLLLTFLAYSRAPELGFIWDDDQYVIQNPVLRTGDGLWQIWAQPRSIPQYYPAVHSSFWLEYQLWELDAAGYHVVNVALHALAVIVLFIVLARRLGLTLGIAWVAAAIFAVHPVHVESVAWITERKNVLSGLFLLLSLNAYLRFRPLSEDGSVGSLRHYTAALLLFALALLSKTITCSLPAVILVLVWWRRGCITRRDVFPLLPFFALGAVLASVTVFLERTHVGASFDLSPVHRVLIAGRALWFYMGKLLWPEPLIFVYPRWELNARDIGQILYPLMIVVALGLFWRYRSRLGRGPMAAALIFGGMLFPALGFIDVYPMLFSFVADHFQYLASIAVIVLVVGAAAGIPPLAKRPLAQKALSVLVLAVLVALTRERTAVYENLETLWRDTVEQNASAWIAHNNLGNVLSKKGRYGEAERHFRETLRLYPRYGIAYNNLGILRVKQDRVDEAVPFFEKAVLYDPFYAPSQNNLGQCRVDQGRIEEAVFHFEAAIEHSRRYPKPHVNLGILYLRQGRNQLALEYFLEALELDPKNEDALVGAKRARDLLAVGFGSEG